MKTFRLLFTVLAVCLSLQAYGQSTITGTVCDASGYPLYGAGVIVVGHSSVGTVTDLDGKFSINAKPGQQILVSFLGCKDQTVDITTRAHYDVVLEFSSDMLDDVVVVGYGQQKKVNVTGAVSTIDATAFEKRPVFSASTALQGMTPGVTVTTQSGAPGADSGTIRIRGINSFGGSSTSPLVLIDGVEGSIDSIDPALIDNISILKDAASSSIYGSRAANGVILVTTKRSSKDSFSLSYKGYVGYQSPTDIPSLVNAIEHRELMNAMNFNDGKDPAYDEETMRLYRKNMGKDADLYPNTNWQKEILQGSGLMNNHTVSLGIGTDRISMLTTFTYSDREGIIENTDFKRYAFRNNADVKFTDKLSMKLDLSFTNGDRRSNPYQSAIFNFMNNLPADIPNQYTTGLYNGLGMQGNNAVAQLKQGGHNLSNSINLTGAITLTFKPLEWLSFQGMVAPRYSTKNGHNWKRAVTTYQDPAGTGTLQSAPYHTLTESGSRAFYGNYNFLVTMGDNFNGHDIKAILGVERNTYDYRYISAYRQDFKYEYDQIDVGMIENMSNGGHRYEWVLQSYFGRINYNYKERYLIEANLRIDGSSRFKNSNRWGYFPSVSGAWRISEEPFMESLKQTISMFKIRGSYGTLGNQNLAGGDAASYYPTTQNLAMGQISMNGNLYPLATLNTMANPDIVWESTAITDVGVDITLWKNFYITADWYQKNTTNILMKLDTPLGVGLNAPYQNAGKVRNTGWELGLGYNNQWGDFRLGVQANISDVINEIVDMHGKTASSGVLRNEEGHSIASIYALKDLGLIRTQDEADWVNENCPQFGELVHIGDIRYKDVNGDDKIDDADRTFVGTTIPRYTYSANLNIGYKGFDLGVMLQGVGKVDGYLNSYYVMPSQQGRSFRTEHLDHANDANPNGVTPRLTALNTNNFKDSSFWMKPASYLRIKNVQLSYNLPKRVLNSLGVKSLMIYANAQNLFTFTNFWDGYDPEVAYGGSGDGNFDTVAVGAATNYPQVKIFTLGVELKF